MADLIYAEYDAGTSRPSLWAAWRDANRALIPFGSDPHDFTLELAERDDPATILLTKLTGFIAADTNPNVISVWDPTGDLIDLDPALYVGRIVAVSQADGGERHMPVEILIKPGIGATWGT